MEEIDFKPEDEKIAAGTGEEEHGGLAEPQNVEKTYQLVNINPDPDIDPEPDTVHFKA